MFINIYTSTVGKGQLCFFKNTGYSFSTGHSAFWLGKVGCIVWSVEMQMGTSWRLALLCRKACPVSQMSALNGKIPKSSWKCILKPSASQGSVGKHRWAYYFKEAANHFILLVEPCSRQHFWCVFDWALALLLFIRVCQMVYFLLHSICCRSKTFIW